MAEERTVEEEMAARDLLASVLDPSGKRQRRMQKAVIRIATSLLNMDDSEAYSILVSVSSLMMSDPEITKENAINCASDFGKHVTEEVRISFDQHSAVRRSPHPQH